MDRSDGYAPIRDYAVIGDGRAIALVARDCAIDWLALPTVASPPVLAALLDPARGGSFRLAPDEPFEVERRYVGCSNVVETTIRTAGGAVRVTDAITRRLDDQLPWFELARRVEGLAGKVTLRYALDPRFPLSDDDVVSEGTRWRCGDTSLVLLEFEAAEGGVTVQEGESALLAAVATAGQPLPGPERDEIERRLDETVRADESWITEHDYDGPWQDAVERSALVLKLLTHTHRGGIVAAPTTSLPERLGGDSNWDYRFAWVRDSCYTLDALLHLGRREMAHESFAWLLDAIATTAPEIRPLYPIDLGPDLAEREVDLAGYRGSRPVRVGNAAWRQTQLGIYGDVLDTAFRYVEEGNSLDPPTRDLLVSCLRWLAKHWREVDASFWEIRGPGKQYTHSNLATFVAFDRALKLARSGELPNDDAALWLRELDECRAFVESRCWSDELGAYRFYADEDKLDAATLLAYRRDPGRAGERLASTVDVIRDRLGAGGPLLYRHSDAIGEEGAFVACSFWLADALAHLDRLDEAAEVMDGTIALANDVGLFSEEIDPETHEFLGNFPQGLSHLALVQAAAAISRRSSKQARASARRRRR